MRAGQMSGEISDGSDHRRPSLRRGMLVGPVVAAWMEAEVSGSVQSRNAAIAEIRFYESTRNRLRHGEQSPRRFRRSGWSDRRSQSAPFWFGLGMWQAEEGTRLIDDVLEIDQATAFPDDVEQIAMFAGGGVGPFAGRPFRGFLEPYEHGAARCVANIAHQPVTALPPSGGEVVTAHRLGITCETVRQFGGVVTGHHAASRSPTRATG